MKKINQQGAVIIEIILSAIVILAVGATIYASEQKKAGNKIAKTASSVTDANTSSGSSNAVPAYKDWKTYTSPEEGLTFRYPSDWKLVTLPTDIGDLVSVTSPAGFKLEYNSNARGLGGACDPQFGCPDVQTYTVEKLVAANAPSDLYYVEGSFKSNVQGDPNKGKYQPVMGLISKTDTSGIPKVGEQLQSYPYYFIAQKRNTKPTGYVMGYAMFSFSPDVTGKGNSTSLQISPADAKAFFNQPDAKTARLILESVKY